jgi:hypothetical protein
MIMPRTPILIWLAAAGVVSLQACSPSPAPAESAHAMLNEYCLDCHNDVDFTAELSLEELPDDAIELNPETFEKVVRKLRAGLMPPPDSPRPEAAALQIAVRAMEDRLDQAAGDPRMQPGRVPLHRMNRVEYANAVRDLLDMDVDPALLLPADNSSHGFDNIADALALSPALLERYVTAAAKISRVAVGSPEISPLATYYNVKGDLTQTTTIDGLPIGTRGGTAVHHIYPLDGDYVFSIDFVRAALGDVYGGPADGELLEITIDGERVRLIQLDAVPFVGLSDGTGGGLGFSGVPPGAAPGPTPQTPLRDPSAVRVRMDPSMKIEFRLAVPAGPHILGVAFLSDSYRAIEDLVARPTSTMRDTNLGVTYGYQTVPHVSRVDITGPFDASGPGDTPSRRRIFICQPAVAGEERACAAEILTNLARRAYRRPVADGDIESLMSLYEQGRAKGSFEAGIEMALRRILADPEFVFRFERPPAEVPRDGVYALNDIELASRLSFFLWSSIPDDELLAVASRGELSDPEVLRHQTLRMLADPKAQSLATNFAGQWLFLRNVQNASPDRTEFPNFDDNLRQAFVRETELLFESVVNEDRSVLTLLDADYTFVNERLAKHYGIPQIYGPDFRRVPVPNDDRRGVLGHGSLLLVTSNTNRTSPVIRGAWILENIVGSQPPIPPPNVPAFEESVFGVAPRTVRERLEQHRRNPACAGCHNIMDPIGLALENFDAVGRWRTTDAGSPIDATGQLVDGTELDGPSSLREALLRRPDVVVGTMLEKLLMYAIGREITYADMPVVRAILRQAESDAYRFSALVLAIVQSAPFQMRMYEPLADELVAMSESAVEGR